MDSELSRWEPAKDSPMGTLSRLGTPSFCRLSARQPDRPPFRGPGPARLLRATGQGSGASTRSPVLGRGKATIWSEQAAILEENSLGRSQPLSEYDHLKCGNSRLWVEACFVRAEECMNIVSVKIPDIEYRLPIAGNSRTFRVAATTLKAAVQV